MNDLSVSVIIPAYRAARTIARAVASVLAQTCPADQVLVVDDGSPDDLAAPLQPFGACVTLLRKPNGGAASARNVGIDESRGAAIAFLDADDYWEPRKLEVQLGVLRRHPEVGLVAGRFFLEPPGCQRRLLPGPAADSRDRVLRPRGEAVFAAATRIFTSTVLVRRAVLGSQRFPTDLSTAEDRHLWVRLVNAAPIYFLSEPLTTAVEEPHSLSRSDLDADSSNMLRVVRQFRDLLGPRGQRRWEASVFRDWAAGHLGAGQPWAALPRAWQRWRRQPLSVEAWWILMKAATLSCAGVRTSG